MGKQCRCGGILGLEVGNGLGWKSGGQRELDGVQSVWAERLDMHEKSCCLGTLGRAESCFAMKARLSWCMGCRTQAKCVE